MAKVMVTIQSDGPAPSIDELANRFTFTRDDIDPEFGVIRLEPDKPDSRDYVILVSEEAAAKIRGTPGNKASQPFSNPKIAPFGPPES